MRRGQSTTESARRRSAAALIRAYCAVVRRQGAAPFMSFEERHTEALATVLVILLQRGATLTPAAVRALDPTLRGILRRRTDRVRPQPEASGGHEPRSPARPLSIRDDRSRRDVAPTRRHVQLRQGVWVVTAANARRVSSRSAGRKEAVDRASRIVLNGGGGEVVVHAADGRVEQVIAVVAGRRRDR